MVAYAYLFRVQESCAMLGKAWEEAAISSKKDRDARPKTEFAIQGNRSIQGVNGSIHVFSGNPFQVCPFGSKESVQ